MYMNQSYFEEAVESEEEKFWKKSVNMSLFLDFNSYKPYMSVYFVHTNPGFSE